MEADPRLKPFFRRCARDPVFFADSLLPTKTRKVLPDGTVLIHHKQRQWLREAFAPINVLVPGNRFGKSTVVAIRHLWMAMTKFRPNRLYYDPSKPYQTISLAHSSEQANIVFNFIRSIVNSPTFRPFVKSVRESPYPKITLFNDSVVHVRSAHDNGKYVDGFEYAYMSLDEAGYIDDLKSLINGVLIMRLAGGGVLDILGTPKGISSQGMYWYAERGLRKAKRYYGMRGTTYDNPFLPPEDIRMRDEMMRSSDPRVRAQVIEGEFVDYSGLAFTRDQRENLYRQKMPLHVDYIDGHRYHQAWDLGRKTDWTVGFTFDTTTEPWTMVDFVRINQVPWEEIYNIIIRKARDYRVSWPRIDATGPQGDVIEEELFKRGLPVDAYRMSSSALKLDLINTLQTCLDWNREQVDESYWTDEAGMQHSFPIMEEPEPEKDTWGLLRMPPITEVVDEMGVYQLDDKKLTQDCVIALAMVAHRAFMDRGIADAIVGGLY